MRTHAQIEASRRNGQLSRGPKTDAGKARSRQNALKHGLSSNDPKILPPDLAAEVTQQIHAFEQVLKPTNALESALVAQAAVASTRHLRLAKAEAAFAAHAAATAEASVIHKRRADLASATKALLNPHGGLPDVPLQTLQSSAHGRRRLARLWLRLRRRLDETGYLDHGHTRILARLLGRTHNDELPSFSRRTLHALRLAITLLAPHDPLTAQHYARFGLYAMPDPNPFRAELAQFLDAHVAHHTRCAARLERTEGHDPELATAAARALHHDTDESRRLARYLTETDRTLRQSLKALQTLRTQPLASAGAKPTNLQPPTPAPNGAPTTDNGPNHETNPTPPQQSIPKQLATAGELRPEVRE